MGRRVMMKRDLTLKIIIGGNFDKDLDNLLNWKIDLGKHSTNIIYLDSFAQLDKLLSPARLDLFKYLLKVQKTKNPESLTQIAKELQRKKESISRDIKQLDNTGLISLTKVKQTVYAIPKYKAIEIKTSAL
jgi:predicted transcriptional regulator